MTFGGDVDTLNLLFGKLQYIFSGYNPIRESFLEMNNLYKQGKISEYEFFEKLHESINRFSALEFLLIKAIFEIKKTMGRSNDVTFHAPQISSTNVSPPSHLLASFVTAKNLPKPEISGTSSPIESKVCAHCGAKVKKLSKFCTNCGNTLQ